MITRGAYLLSLASIAACGGGGPERAAQQDQASPPQPLPPVAATKQFVDVTATSGIAYSPGFAEAIVPWELEVMATAGGVASGDYDNDGDIDLFIVRGDVGPNLLYRNNGGMTFTDVASSAGIAFTKSATENYRHAGPMFADMDGDRDLDLFLGGLDDDPSLIFENLGDGTFADVTAGSGIDTLNARNNVSAAFGDYDLDGDLDLFVAHWGTARDYVTPGDTEHLWRNDSDAQGIRFTSVSEPSGISPTIINLPDDKSALHNWDFTFSPAFARIDDNLAPDILSVADFNTSQYFVNNLDGTFSNATDTDVLIDDNGMGSAVGDYDNDGDLDWFVSSIRFHGSPERIGNRLYRNEGGVFTDVTDSAGVASGGWGWASCFVDLDNDGDLDIFHTNGWPLVDGSNNYETDKSRAFVSDGAGRFAERAEALGLDDEDEGRGVVCADFDGDGDVDIFQMSITGPRLRRNDASGNNYVAVLLRGKAPNTEAAGARIFVTAGGTTQLREICIASNFMSQNPAVQTIGLGAATQADRIRIQWPDGRESELSNVQAGQRVTIDQPGL